MTAEQLAMFDEYSPRVRGVAASYSRRSQSDPASNQAAALVGLWEAIMAFQPGQGDFWPFAHYRVRGAIVDAHRELNGSSPGRHHLSAAIPFSTIADAQAANGWEPSLSSARRDGPANVDDRDEIDHVLAALPKRLRILLLRYHRDGHTLRDIARLWDSSEATVSRQLSRATRLIAQRFGSAEPTNGG
jgi:RNA polymerase sigma factor (sigma-70 family)